MNQKLLFNLLVLTFILAGCWPEKEEEVMGLRPIYGTPEDLEVRILPAQDICQSGKIYVYGQYLLVNDVHKGIHIINNEDPANPKKLSFIKIVGNVDLAVKNGYLYADHLNSMVVIDMTNPINPKFVRAVERAFSNGYNQYPSATNVRFECVDPSKGPVIGWAEALLYKPECYR